MSFCYIIIRPYQPKPWKLSSLAIWTILLSALSTDETDQEVVLRSCYPGNLENGCSEGEYTEDGVTIRGEVCICNDSLCNSAKQNGLSMTLAWIGAFIITKFF